MNRIPFITAGATVVIIAGAAVASGAVSSPDVPPVKTLAQALRVAIVAPPVQGITARITFTNKLIDSSGLSGGDALLVGASGRLWLAADGRARIELQSDRGDAQIVSDGKKVTIYDASSNTAYEAALPQEASGHASGDAPDATTPESTTPPSVDKISQVLAKLGKAVDIAGPDPTAIAGQGAYSVKLTPHHGGLVGKAEIAWDAATGVPLRAGLYATGATKPVLELAATDISYGAVDATALSVPIPAGAKVETIDVPASQDGASRDDHGLSSADQARLKAEYEKTAALTPSQVASALPFTLSAPDSLGGMPRTNVRLLSHPSTAASGAGDASATKGALVSYGTGLGGIAVLETAAKGPGTPATTPATTSPSGMGHHRDGSGPAVSMPSVNINGAKASVLTTALGTLVRFQRGGVQYTVVGSITSAVAEAAARGL